MTSLAIDVAEPFGALYEPHRYKVFHGGRGGAKSWEFARALLIQGRQKRQLFICAREFQNSIDDSVHRLLADQIELLGFQDFYEVQNQRIIGKNGTEFVFKGIKNNINNIKSFEGADVCWVEEAVNVSEHSWDVLIPTIRKPNSEIWLSFNPEDELDNTYQRFVLHPPETAYVRKVTYRDNPWFPPELEAERVACKAENYNKYLHIWEGEPNADYEDSLIQPEWFNAAVDLHDKLGFEPQGIQGLGFDPADTGSDDKALAERHGSVVLGVESWSDGDIESAIDRAFSTAFERRAQYLVYDAVGIGTAVKVGLDKRIAGRDITVTGFVGGERPRYPDDLYNGDRKNRDTFRNLRAQYWWYLRDRFEAAYRASEGQYIDPLKLISISSDIKELSDLRSELCRVQRKRGQFSNTYIQVESKDDMRKRQMPSPNRADALVMAFANLPPKKAKPKRNYPKLSIA